MIGLRRLTLILIAIMAVMFAVSCEDKSSSNNGDPVVNNNRLVTTIDLTGPAQLVNYYGKTDTLELTAKALDLDGVAVERAEVEFSIESGFGSIVLQDTITDANGDQKAYYIVSLLDENQNDVVIRASVRDTYDEKTLMVQALPVHIRISASNNNPQVITGGKASSRLTVTVVDGQSVGVVGIPIRIEATQLPPDDMVMSPVDVTGSTGSDTCSIVVYPVTQMDTITVRATIDVEAPASTDGKKGGLTKLRDRIGGMLKGQSSTSGLVDRTTASTLTITKTIIVEPRENTISNVYVSISPDHMTLAADESELAEVTAVAFDENNNGISDLQFLFRVVHADGSSPTGIISYPTKTDSSGTAYATLETNRQYGTWYIDVRATPDQEPPWRTSITVEPSPTVGGTLNLTLIGDDPIYADNGVTIKQILAVLKDQDLVAIENDTITFAAHGTGSIPARMLTNAAGEVTVNFSDTGDSTITGEPAMIVARYHKQSANIDLRDTVFVSILPNRQIDQLNVRIDPNDVVTASDIDSIDITVSAFYAAPDNSPVEDGTPILIQSGRNGQNANIDSTLNGIAHFKYGYGSISGIDSIRIGAPNGQGDENIFWTDWRQITINHGSPSSFMGVVASQTQINIADRTPIQVAAVVVDTFNNTVSAGYTVDWTASAGSVTPSSLTDSDGIAFASYTAGTQAGTAKIYAHLGLLDTDSTTVTVISGTPQSVEVNSASPEISVIGTGGQPTTTITANVNDPNGNPVPNGTPTFFLLRTFPTTIGSVNPRINDNDGTNHGDLPPRFQQYATMQLPFDSLETNNGTAQVSVTSGSEMGLLELIVWAYTDEERSDSVFAIFTGLQVVAGPPASIDIDINEGGTDGGGAVWNLEVSAEVSDRRNNPVKDGIQVNFTVIEEIATIGSGITGNDDISGESTAGVAHTTLSYNSANTNQSITIVAQVLSSDGGTIESQYEDFVLPIQTPQGDLSVDRFNWFFGDDPAEFEVELFVYDGHTHCINGQLVRFLASHGEYHTMRSLGSPVDPEMISGDNDAYPDIECGWARRYLLIPYTEAFPDPSQLQTSAQIEAILPGRDDATISPLTVDMRHPL